MKNPTYEKDTLNLYVTVRDGDVRKGIYRAIAALEVKSAKIDECVKYGFKRKDVTAALDGCVSSMEIVSKRLLKMIESRREFVRKRRDKAGITIKENAGPTQNHGHISPALVKYMTASMIEVCARCELKVPEILALLVAYALEADLAVSGKSVRAVERFHQIMHYVAENLTATNAEIASAIGTSESEIPQFREEIAEIFENEIAAVKAGSAKAAKKRI